MRLPAHGFLKASRPIFATYHTPAEPVRDAAYVICPPLGWEAIQCYHTLRLLGEDLARMGVGALRLAYDGTGESPGSDEDPARVRAWLESIHIAVESVRRAPGVRTVGLIGLRMGATLAARASAEHEVDRLALWEPCLSGAHYTREMEIFASAAPRLVHGGGGSEADGDGGEAPDATRWIEAGGYLLTAETARDLAAVDLMRVQPSGGPEVLLLARDDGLRPTRLAEHLTRSGCTVDLEQAAGFKEMMVYPQRSVPPRAAMERIGRWATAHFAPTTAGSPAQAGTAWLPDEATHGGIRRRAFRFGPDERLFGVLGEPEGGSDPTVPAVLLLAGGIVPRTAVNGMYVTLADRLVRRGHRVLRIDVSGIGESFAGPGQPGGDPYPPSLLDDVRAALHELTNDHETRDLWLVGLCSGAYAAFRTAHENSRVVGAVLVNPLVYGHHGGASLRSTDTEQYAAATYYRRALFSPASWKRVLQRRAGLRGPLKLLARRSGDWVGARVGRLYGVLGAQPTGVTADFLQLLGRGAAVHVVFSDGDPGIEALARQLGGDTRRLERAGLDLVVLPGADHTFNGLGARRALLDRIDSIVSGSAGSPAAAHEEHQTERDGRGRDGGQRGVEQP